jgi:ADP-ribose pyrophosphatase YjhB (NUDIX family)
MDCGQFLMFGLELALPGWYVEHSEMIQDAAVRELIEEARSVSQGGALQPQFLKNCIRPGASSTI